MLQNKQSSKKSNNQHTKHHFFTRNLLGSTLLILSFIALLVSSRNGLFGVTGQQYAGLVTQNPPHKKDKVQPVIPLTFSYQIENKQGRRIGKIGDRCCTGDRIVMSVAAGFDCWLTVFCIDSRKTQPVFRSSLDPSKIAGKQQYDLTFKLDDNVGTEIYYAVAAHDKFSFDKEIYPYIDTLRYSLSYYHPDGTAKGPLSATHNLNLPEKFSFNVIYFDHVGPFDMKDSTVLLQPIAESR